MDGDERQMWHHGIHRRPFLFRSRHRSLPPGRKRRSALAVAGPFVAAGFVLAFVLYVLLPRPSGYLAAGSPPPLPGTCTVACGWSFTPSPEPSWTDVSTDRQQQTSQPRQPRPAPVLPPPSVETSPVPSSSSSPSPTYTGAGDMIPDPTLTACPPPLPTDTGKVRKPRPSRSPKR